MPHPTGFGTGSRARDRAEPFAIGGQLVPPGERLRFDLPAARLPTHTQLNIPVCVVHGRKPGPTVWVSAAVHGDEVNGVEIIRRLLERIKDPLRRGTVIAVPILNVFGFIEQSLYLPDRRDLNRSFPGSKKGSLAARIAHLFMTEVVSRCTHGIDLHTAAQDRSNLPQVRGNMSHPETRAIAETFGAPALVQSDVRGGSLRAAAAKRGIPVLVYEGGEALRFDETAIDIGTLGCLRVLTSLGMLGRGPRTPRSHSILVEDSTWIRARRGGLVRLKVHDGALVEEGEQIGVIGDPLGVELHRIRAPFRGLVLGRATNPVVHGGDALVHLGRVPSGQGAP